MKRNLKLSSKELKYLVAFLAVVTVTVSALTYTQLSPPYTDQFFSMWIVGPNGLASNYYPNNNPTLIPGEEVNWVVGVYNHMNALEYVVVRVKLLNATEIAPNELTGVASPAPEIFEFARILVNNETWMISFPWEIIDTSTANNVMTITRLVVNGTTLSGNLAQAVGGSDFRFVFELWFYDPNGGTLVFSWSTPSSSYSAWTQLWFNVTGGT